MKWIDRKPILYWKGNLDVGAPILLYKEIV
jgi:hypothetical protein